MRSTIALFKELYRSLPPLFPPETAKKMRHALTHLESDGSLTVQEIEDTMIAFGYEAWPWIRAYRDFLVMAESKVGEHFLLPKLRPETKKRFHDFKTYGGTLRDLHTGHPAEFFTLEERQDLSEALSLIRSELRDFTDREVIGTEKTKYLNRVFEFIKILESIKNTLAELRRIADGEQDHPVLADEIRSRVRAFEYGLCLLGPEPKEEDVSKAPEYYSGRRHELQRLRGIHIPVEFKFED